nr:cupin domain-containing protein [Marinicella sp. W31]MDC2876196.1 cupin domain-containing protein [Marinicella sp. W31]
MANSRPFADLLSGGWRDLPFEPFRDGVDVHYLWQVEEGPVWAFLRYQPGASVPEHLHTGLETIIVVDGVQSDESGTYGTGSVICNPPGTRHSVWTDEGCVVFIQWERPVEIL